MSLVRVLVRGGILVLFGFAAVVAMTILFSAQMRFDQHAELQMKGVRAPRTASAMMATAATSMSTQADGETLSSAARETELNTDPPSAGEPDVGDTTGSVRLTPLTPTQIAGLVGITSPPEPRLRSAPEAALAEGKKAVTVHVNKAEGALDSPGADRWVDVVLTRQLANDAAVNDVVVQKARVLAVDRGADFARGERASTDAVTLEVDTEDAQKLLLASRFGTLSLILRASGDHSVHEARQVGVSDLIKAAPTPEPDDDRFTLVRINRPGTGPTVHRVPKER